MQIKYLKKGQIFTQGISFESFCEKEIDDKIGKLLISQFPNRFEEVQNKVKNIETEIKVETPKTEVQEEATETKTTKRKSTKTKIEEK